MDLSAICRARPHAAGDDHPPSPSGAEAGDPQLECEEILAAIAAGKTVCIWWRPRRSYRARRQPAMAGGGWVRPSTTSPTAAAERERDRNQAFLNTVIQQGAGDHLRSGCHDRRYLLINGAGEKYLGVTREQMVERRRASCSPEASPT